MKKRRGRIFIISSPSGGGKTTVCNRIKKSRFDIAYSISATTRKRRSGEQNGRDYYFLSEGEFRRLIRKKGFLEWTDNFGSLYGTPKGAVEKSIKKGRDIILSIDVKGAMRVKGMYKNAVLIFLLPPSIADLKKRLKKRKTENKKTFARRINVAKRELTYLGKYDYVVVNDTLTEAVKVLKSIIITERGKTRR